MLNKTVTLLGPLTCGHLVRGLSVTLVAITAMLGGCATKPPASNIQAVADYERRNDPIEPLNRYFFELDRFMDYMFMEPVAEIYAGITPDFVQHGIRNFIDNVNSPVTLANDLLQGSFDRADITAKRLFLNTTVGIGGFYDFAADHGLPKHTEDFGQTLGVWGVGEGPYFVAPFLGPAPPRDLVGKGVDLALNPLTWVLPANNLDAAGYGLKAANLISSRAASITEVKELEASSIDLYAAVRNLYRQQRAAAIANKD